MGLILFYLHLQVIQSTTWQIMWMYTYIWLVSLTLTQTVANQNAGIINATRNDAFKWRWHYSGDQVSTQKYGTNLYVGASL